MKSLIEYMVCFSMCRVYGICFSMCRVYGICFSMCRMCTTVL